MEVYLLSNHLTKYEQLQCENNALRDIIAAMKRSNRQKTQENVFLAGKVAGMELAMTTLLHVICDNEH
jgi:hypothetical protein